MKKIILVSALTAIYFGSFAQTDSMRKKNDYKIDTNQNNNHDPYKNTSREHLRKDSTNNVCTVKMEDGKMMLIKDGKTVVMDKQITTKNGAVVMTDGTVKMKDGKTTKMKNGECMNMSDKIIAVKNTPIKESYKSGTK